MVNLYDTVPTVPMQDLYNIVKHNFQAGFEGKTDQFFYNIDFYLDAVPHTKQEFVDRGIKRLEQLADENKWKKRDELFDGVTEDYLAIFTSLEDFVHIGVDMYEEVKGIPTSIYTRNQDILTQLYNRGQLEGDIDKLLNNLRGNKTYNALKEGTFATVRLDHIQTTIKGKEIFKAVVPRSSLNIGKGKQFVFIPLPFYQIFDNMVKQQFSNTPFTYTKQSVIGPTTRTATISSDVVRNTYAGQDANQVENKIRKFEPGFNPARQVFLAYDLESSLTSLGISQFRPEMLDAIKPTKLEDIDKSRHAIDFKLLRGIFKTRVMNLNKQDLEKLNFIDLQGFANMSDQQEAIFAKLNNTSDRDVYLFMKNNPQTYGDIEEALEKRERVSPKFLKHFQAVALPTTVRERKQAVEEMLKTGAVKFIATRKSGTVFERIGTSNEQILERMLGKDYVKNFESIRNKLYHVRGMIKDGQLTTKQDYEKVGVEYNILDNLNLEDFFSGDPNLAIETINEEIERLKERAANRKVSEGAVLYRDIQATEPKEFFGSVDVSNIMAIEYSEM